MFRVILSSCRARVRYSRYTMNIKIDEMVDLDRWMPMDEVFKIDNIFLGWLRHIILSTVKEASSLKALASERNRET